MTCTALLETDSNSNEGESDSKNHNLGAMEETASCA